MRVHASPRLVVEFSRNALPVLTLVAHGELGETLQLAEAEEGVLGQSLPLVEGEAGFAVVAVGLGVFLFGGGGVGFVSFLGGFLLLLGYVLVLFGAGIGLLGFDLVDFDGIADLGPALLDLGLAALHLFGDLLGSVAFGHQLLELGVFLRGPFAEVGVLDRVSLNE